MAPTPRNSRRPQPERGASLVEYSLLVALIAIVAIVALALAGEEVSGTFSSVASGLSSA